MKVFLKLGWFFKQQKTSYLIGLGTLLLIALIEIVPPQIIGRTIDEMTSMYGDYLYLEQVKN